MPHVRKLEPEEARSIEDRGKGQRKLIEEQYDRFLADCSLGDYGEAFPEPGERRLTVRNRLKAAARRKGLPLTFLRTRGEVILFKVEEPSANGQLSRAGRTRRERGVQEPTPAVPSLNQATAKRRGRPRKSE